MRSQFRGDSSLFRGSNSDWRFSLAQIGQIMRLINQCRQETTPITTTPTPIITDLPLRPTIGPIAWYGGGYPAWWFSLMEFLAFVDSIGDEYGEVIGYEIDEPEEP